MNERPPSTMTNNFLMFIMLAFGVVIVNNMLFNPKKPPQQAAQPADEKDGKKGDAKKDPKAKDADKKGEVKKDDAAKKSGDGKQADALEKDKNKKDAAEKAAVVLPSKAVPAIDGPARFVCLGSADPKSPYRMLVTLTDRGAAVVRAELNSARYRSLSDEEGYLADKGGYLGHLVVDEVKNPKGGCPVQVVGRDTPAERAGLKPGDSITSLAGMEITGSRSLREAMKKTRPGRTVEIGILRDGKPKTLSAKLTLPLMEVLRPEGAARLAGPDPSSFLLTLSQVDDKSLPRLDAPEEDAKDLDPDLDKADAERIKKDREQAFLQGRPGSVDRELDGLNLRNGAWKIAKNTPTEARFECDLEHLGLRVAKTYRLAETPQDKDDADFKSYHLTLQVEVVNVGKSARTVGYQLDGPTGLPIEGWWYATKVGLDDVWNAGMRDVVFSRPDGGDSKREVGMFGCAAIAKNNDLGKPLQDKPITFIGVDALYFSSIMIPVKQDVEKPWIAEAAPIRVGPVDPNIVKNTDVTCRLRGKARELAPGESISHTYEVFVGPKRPELLAQYGLGDIISYGWFHWFAQPLVGLLHFLHGIVFNWGVAIILLTVVVRGAMFPLSRKQAIGAQKMAMIQPELKKLQEKYKKDLEGRSRAQRELFKKHGYNPASGCLVLFIQMPIFIGLYRGLMVDVELRGSSLLGTAVQWCSNLAAPDMLFDWSGWMPEYFTRGLGMFVLGPYFNLLPLITIVLFILQQKMFMPPPVDEQQAMQQKMMKYMMVFMGVMFFKVAAGLCVYFIASSLWGLAERRFLPKSALALADGDPSSSTRPGGPAERRAKAKEKRR